MRRMFWSFWSESLSMSIFLGRSARLQRPINRPDQALTRHTISVVGFVRQYYAVLRSETRGDRLALRGAVLTPAVCDDREQVA